MKRCFPHESAWTAAAVAAVMCMTVTACGKKKGASGPVLKLNGKNMGAKHHIALRLTSHAQELSYVDDILVVSSNCKLSCSWLGRNHKYGLLKSKDCPNAEVVMIRFKGKSNLKPGKFTTNNGPGLSRGIWIIAYRGKKRLEVSGGGAIELLKTGTNNSVNPKKWSDHLSYKASFQVKKGETKSVTAQGLLKSFTTSGPVKVKICPGLHRN